MLPLRTIKAQQMSDTVSVSEITTDLYPQAPRPVAPVGVVGQFVFRSPRLILIEMEADHVER